MTAPHKTLAAAMNAVMSEVKYVQKDKQMEAGGRYRYVSDGALIDALRPSMVSHGIVVAPVAVELLAAEQYTTAKGGQMNRMVLKITYRFTHAGSGETLDVVTVGESADSGDKCANKCMTAAQKYALRQAFTIETGNDPDDTPSEQVQRARPEPARVAPEKPAATPANGQELHRRLQDYDAKLAKQGLCERGDLLAYVTRCGVRAGYPANVNDWGSPAVQLAVESVKHFDALLRELDRTGRQRAETMAWLNSRYPGQFNYTEKTRYSDLPEAHVRALVEDGLMPLPDAVKE